jgi:hypothetical protein
MNGRMFDSTSHKHNVENVRTYTRCSTQTGTKYNNSSNRAEFRLMGGGRINWVVD